MKLTSAVLVLSTTTSTAAAAKLRQPQQATSTRSLQNKVCPTIAQLDFPNIVYCSTGHIRNEVDAYLGGAPCDLNGELVNRDAVIRHLGFDADWGVAMENLSSICRTQLTPCSTNPNELEESFPTLVNCHEHTIRQTINGMIPEDCDRNQDQEGVALAPDEYTVWRDGNEATMDAKDYFMEQCEEQITPCASIDDLLINFSTIPDCNRREIEKDIAALQEADGTCSRPAPWDGILLAKALMLSEDPQETEFPTLWNSNDPSIITASQILEAKCETIIQSCVDSDLLYAGFETIRYCEGRFMLEDVASLQNESCRRSKEQDAMLVTDRTVWYDRHGVTPDAHTKLVHDCAELQTPSVPLSELEADMVEMRFCHWNFIRNAVMERQPESARRDGSEDALLLAGELLKAQDTSGKDQVLITTARDDNFLGFLRAEYPDTMYYSMSWNTAHEGTYHPPTILMEHCNDLIKTCVTDFDAFHAGFTTIESCNSDKIDLLMGAHQSRATCERPSHEEGPLLVREYERIANPTVDPPTDYVWGGNNPDKNAALYLQEICLDEIESCVPGSVLDFTDIDLCDNHRIQNLITASQAEGCTRHPINDGVLIVRDLTGEEDLRPWWGNDDTTESAFEYLIAKCHNEAKSCVESYDDLNFKDIHYCNENFIKNEISANQDEECTRHVHTDAAMLVREKHVDDHGEDDVPVYVYKDSNPNTPDALDTLMASCQADVTACATIEELEFEHLRTCNTAYIREEIRKHRDDGCTSDRHEHYDAALMTGIDNHNDAMAELQRQCEERITPCTDLETLDFSQIRSCSDWDMLNLIDDTREAMGDLCPSYGTRHSKEEAFLITGKSVWNNRTDDIDDARDVLYNKCMDKVESCTLRTGDSLEVEGCDYADFKDAVDLALRADASCNRSRDFELYALDRELREKSGVGTQEWIDVKCAEAWNTIPESTFAEVDAEFDNDFMEEYIDGKTHLNSETGNFQGDCVYDRNAEIGYNISSFKMYQSHQTRMQGIESLKQCSGQAIMCCFGRDRQFGDNNGNCAIESRGGCDDADPADNSNLCATETREYPPDADPNLEQDIHCHGLAWGDDINDFGKHLMFNNFFFVSLYDHMYSRGYVERTIRHEDDPAPFGMCDCLEDMPPVTRSDCTEVVTNPFVVTRPATNEIVATAPENLDVEFNACKGDGRSNDLSTRIKRLNRLGRLSDDVMNESWNTLVGYENPNDNDNQAACDAYLAKQA